MLFLKSWLEDYVQIDLENQKLAEIITTKSSETEEITEIIDYFANLVVIGRIENIKIHPESSKLQIFEVNLGKKNKQNSQSQNEKTPNQATENSTKNYDQKVQIISAAPNVREGLIVPVALVGAKLPFLTVGAKKLMGTESQGICLGMSELALETNYSSGLWELNELLTQKLQRENPQQTPKNLKKLENLQSDNDQIENGKMEALKDVELADFDSTNSDLESFLGRSICEVLPQFFRPETVLDIKVLPDQISRIGHHLGMALEIATILENHNLLTEFGKRALRTENRLKTTNLDQKNNPLNTAEIPENSQNSAGQNSAKLNENMNLKNSKYANSSSQNSQPDISSSQTLQNPNKEKLNQEDLKLSEKISNKENSSLENNLFLSENFDSCDKTDTVNFENTFADSFGGTNNFDLYNLKLEKPFVLPHNLQMRMFLTSHNLVGGIVDLSNYLLVDMGQPSHFFDAQKV